MAELRLMPTQTDELFDSGWGEDNKYACRKIEEERARVVSPGSKRMAAARLLLLHSKKVKIK